MLSVHFIIFISKIKLNLPPENYEGKWLSLDILLIFKGKNPEITLNEWNSS